MRLRQTLDDDTMPYTAAHVKEFRSIWAVNHGTQGLSPLEREQSMIVEFQLSLEGQAARWYAQQDVNTAEEPRNVIIAKGLDPEFKEQLTHVL
jgi:hypothetical protein